MNSARSLFAMIGMTIASLACTTAGAQSISIIGQDPGAPCANAAAAVVAGSATTRQGILDCTQALRSEALGRPDRAAAYLNLGVLRDGAADHAGAIADFNAAIRLNPTLAEAYLNRGVAYVNLHRLADAVADYTQAIALNSANPAMAYFDRALAYEDQGNLKAAYRDYLAASRLAPDWAEPKQQLSRFTVVRPQAMG